MDSISPPTAPTAGINSKSAKLSLPNTPLIPRGYLQSPSAVAADSLSSSGSSIMIRPLTSIFNDTAPMGRSPSPLHIDTDSTPYIPSAGSSSRKRNDIKIAVEFEHDSLPSIPYGMSTPSLTTIMGKASVVRFAPSTAIDTSAGVSSESPLFGVAKIDHLAGVYCNSRVSDSYCTAARYDDDPSGNIVFDKLMISSASVKEDGEKSSVADRERDDSFKVVGVVPTSMGMTGRVVVYLSPKRGFRAVGNDVISVVPGVKPGRESVDTPAAGGSPESAKERLIKIDTSNLVVRFTAADSIEKKVRGIWKGRARQDELYGCETRREICANGTPVVDKSGFCPFNTLCKAQKMQSLYLASELREAGLFSGALIRRISWRIADCPDRTQENFRIGFKWTTDDVLSDLEENVEICYGPATLRHNSFILNEWMTFNLEKVIEWDGRSNLIVEISKDETHSSFSWPATGGIFFRPTVNSRTLAHKDNNDTSGQYPFTSSQKATRFRRIPCISLEASSRPCFKIVCCVPLSTFHDQLVSAEVSVDGHKYSKEAASFLCRRNEPTAVTKLMSDMSRLLDSNYQLRNNRFHDVEFRVGIDRVEFRAHSVLLSARSSIFKSIFAKAVKESDQYVIEVPDIQPPVFTSLLQFFYIASVEIDLENACELLSAALKYELDDLKRSCEEFMKQSVRCENVTSLLLSAEKWNIPSIRSFCLDFVLWHFDAVSKTEGFSRDLIPKHDIMREILLSRRSFLSRRAHPASIRSTGPGNINVLNAARAIVGAQLADLDRTLVSFPETLLTDFGRLVRYSLPAPSLELQNGDSQDTFDAVFIVGKGLSAEGEGTMFLAHQVLLSSRCEVFEGMFLRSQMKEAKDHVIQIPNISPTVFASVLRYLYTAECDIQFENVFELYRAADQYVLEDLKICCEEYVMQEISIDNVAYMLMNADQWQVQNVREYCLDLTIKEFDEVSITPGFLEEIIPRHDLLMDIFQGRTCE